MMEEIFREVPTPQGPWGPSIGASAHRHNVSGTPGDIIVATMNRLTQWSGL